MFGTSRSGSISQRVPMPPHSGQAPYGLLKENIRGETSGKEMPQSAHASRSEKTMGSAVIGVVELLSLMSGRALEAGVLVRPP